MANRVVAHNRDFAEHSGFLQKKGIDFFDKLDKNGENKFYDPVDGKLLFIAPRGRTFEEFKKESLDHGWPSFRDEECVSENI